ncbi:sulfotransferase domain-containing protein [Bauldia litoralis]|uniref:Sulfotransferase domain-containing protein n=1 Tax=Bauldia litoralis TaxID=665467 RepID=A0A1G6DPZ0_9HYPH|nr:sulfotransferase domain-containing protein [Bauldia litoralis]SDB47277.1 Sulfotransferase domain-containing protein [Bauldia litoralis]
MISVDPNAPRGIVWIASYPKSGNTWVRVFVHHLLRMAAGKPLEPHDIDELHRTSRSPAIRIDLFERFLGKPVTAANAREITEARLQVHQAIADEADGIVFAKTHSFNGEIFGYPMINRAHSAGALYIVRNPLDVAVSLANHLNVPIDSAIDSLAMSLNSPVETEESASEVWGSWTENVRSWTSNPPPVIQVTRYEDLLADPRARFGDMVEHLRLDVTPEQIDEAVALASFDRMRAAEEKSGFYERPEHTERFFREGRAGQWREVLSPEQIQRIVDDHGEQMARFGYLPSH